MKNRNNQNDLTDSRHAPKNKITLVVFSIIIGYFLVTEHLAHVIQALPYLLIFVCIGMHLFMHRGHSHGAPSQSSSNKEKNSERHENE